jgi:hypothetical protein
VREQGVRGRSGGTLTSACICGRVAGSRTFAQNTLGQTVTLFAYIYRRKAHKRTGFATTGALLAIIGWKLNGPGLGWIDTRRGAVGEVEEETLRGASCNGDIGVGGDIEAGNEDESGDSSPELPVSGGEAGKRNPSKPNPSMGVGGWTCGEGIRIGSE